MYALDSFVDFIRKNEVVGVDIGVAMQGNSEMHSYNFSTVRPLWELGGFEFSTNYLKIVRVIVITSDKMTLFKYFFSNYDH